MFWYYTNLTITTIETAKRAPIVPTPTSNGCLDCSPEVTLDRHLTPATLTWGKRFRPSSGVSKVLTQTSSDDSLPVHVTLLNWIVLLGLP